MVDIPQESSDLLTTTFADGQADGEITAQDMRDLIVSLMPAHGVMDMASNVTETTITTASVFVAVGGTFVVGGNPSEVTEATSGVFTYTGTPDRHFRIGATLDFISATDNQVISFQWYHEGVAIGSPVNHKALTGADVVSLGINADAILVTSDELELRVANLTSTGNVTIGNCYMSILGHIV